MKITIIFILNFLSASLRVTAGDRSAARKNQVIESAAEKDFSGTVSQLQFQVQHLLGGFAALQKKLDATDAVLDALLTEAAALRAFKAETKVGITYLQAAKAEKTDVDALHTNAAALRTDVANLQATKTNTTVFESEPSRRLQTNCNSCTTISGIQDNITSLQAQVQELKISKADKTNVDALQAKTSCISASSTVTNLIFRGCNVNIQNGANSTNSTNTHGNLIIGYNEVNGRAAADRVGSHNFIVGDGHAYTKYGGIVVGYYNKISGDYSSISGGYNNVATGTGSSVSGGTGNTASGKYSVVLGGYNNKASGYASVVVGNKGNSTGTTTCANYNVCPIDMDVAALQASKAEISYVNELITNLQVSKANNSDVTALTTKTSCINANSTATNLIFRGCNVHVQNGHVDSKTDTTNNLGNLVIGYNEQRTPAAARNGSHNFIVGPYHTYTGYGGIVGGNKNTISGAYSSVIGGQINEAVGQFSVVLGGAYNKASAAYNVVTGGRNNNADGGFSVVVGNKDGDATGTATCAAYKICPIDQDVATLQASKAEISYVNELFTNLQVSKANNSDVTALTTKTSCINANSTATNLIFRGCNVHVQNGHVDSKTDTTNNLGNLVIGYNEQRTPAAARNGSHNFIVGPYHTYTGYGGIVGGNKNTISGAYSSVIGGQINEAVGQFSVVLGGAYNKASAAYSVVTGGRNNNADGGFSVVVGNKDGDATGTAACAAYKICPIDKDVATLQASKAEISYVNELFTNLQVSKANNSDVTALTTKTSCINVNSTATNLIFRGCNVHVQNGHVDSKTDTTNNLGNLVIGYNEQRTPAAARNGSHNFIVGPYHTYTGYGGIVGGNKNTISGAYSSVIGGQINEGGGQFSVVLGGAYNKASAAYSVVTGGRNNNADGGFSVVVGNKDGDATGTATCAAYKICPSGI